MRLVPSCIADSAKEDLKASSRSGYRSFNNHHLGEPATAVVSGYVCFGRNFTVRFRSDCGERLAQPSELLRGPSEGAFDGRCLGDVPDASSRALSSTLMTKTP